MAKITDPDGLDRFMVAVDPIAETVSLRGLGTLRHAVDQTGSTAGTTTFTDAGADFVTTDGIIAGDILTIISDPADDGGIIGHYRVVTPGATTLVVDRAIPTSTAADLTYVVNAKQTTGAVGEQLADGVNMQALFSFLKEEWITLAAGLGGAIDLNAFDFPLVAISSAAGQYIMGGVNGDAASAWKFADLNGTEASDDEGVPRELVRAGGWQEKSATDVIISEYANYTTLGALDADAQATYQQGDETGDPVNFKLLGPVDQAVLTFGPDVGPDITATGFAFAATTITRNDGGNWATDNYRVGDYVTTRLAEDGPNIGSFGPITAVDNSVDGAITIASASFTVNADDTTVIIQVDHRRYTQLRARKKGRTYSAAVHVDAGIPATGILALVNKFPLAHAVDPAILLEDGVLSGGDGTATGDIFQENEAIVSASVDGATEAEPTAAPDRFTLTSATGGFQTSARTPVIDIIVPGDSVTITTGADAGTYEVASITSDTVIVLFKEPSVTYTGNETGRTFNAFSGVLDVGDTDAVLADVDGDTGTLTSATDSTFDVDTAAGDRQVNTGDIVEVFSGTNTVIGYYKVVSRTSATVLVLNTSDQIFSGETAQSYRIWRPGMKLQRFQTLATTVGPITSFDFNDTNPDTIDRNDAGNFITDGYNIPGLMLTTTLATVAANNGVRIVASATAGVITLIAEETLTADTIDTAAVLNGEYGITRTINSITYPFHWRLFANNGTLTQVFQFLQRELRRATDIDGGSGISRGDITDLLMTFASPNGVTLDLFPDNLSTTELNNVTYQDMSGDSRNNAFLVGITFDVNANIISSANSRLVAYFTSVPSGDFGTNTAVKVQDDGAADMDFTAIGADIPTTFDDTNNNQGGRTPDTDAAITGVALGDNLAQHILTTALITKSNSVVVSVQPPLERNYAT